MRSEMKYPKIFFDGIDYSDDPESAKVLLFQLMESHSRLAQAEYERNPAYTNEHFSALAEHKIIGELTPKLITEYFEYLKEGSDND